MAVYKEEKTNTWRVLYRYTDWNGERKQSQKRGFKTKREAQAWEREQLNKLGGDLDMNFKSFVQHYTEDMQSRIKENTWATKAHIIQTKLIPYFGKLKMCNINAQQIITWQNELAYLDDIEQQATAMFLRLVKELAEKENVTEELKATDQMLWVQKMNNIRNRATEIVNAELIYTV